MTELPVHLAVWRVLVGFPKYAIAWTAGLIVAILADLNITTFAVTALFVGLVVHNVLIGVASFFLIYSYARVQAFSQR